MSDSDEKTAGASVESIRERFFHPNVYRDPGEANVERFGLEIHPVVFPLSVVLIATVVALTVGAREQAATVYRATFASVNRNFGWFYVLAVNVFLGALLAFGFSTYGNVRLGGPEADPEFSTFSWVAMLFTAGMGIGLLFFGVAEPMYHFLSGGGSFFDVAPRTPAAGRAATAITMFHWGFHPWAIYGVVGLGLAFFTYNRGLPLSFRSVFYPVLGARIYGWPGHAVDLTAIVATIFGLATTTGLSALQITAGLDFVATNYVDTTLPTNVWTTVAIIAALVGVTTLSVVAGIERGIKRLSRTNVFLMVALLVFLFVTGPTTYLLDVLDSGLAAYLGNFVELSFYAEAFAGEGAGWQHKWTLFFWGFWIVWAPFVGMFIARISKGRTVREFVTGVLIVPAGFSLLWMAVFNGSALFVELNVASGGIVGPLRAEGRAVALFELLSFYPLTFATSVVAIASLVTFFVTSTDSGALAIGYLTAGGKREIRPLQRITWPLLIGGVAAALLLGNGLDALRTAVITIGLPFGMLMVVMVYTTYRGLHREVEIHRTNGYREALERTSDTKESDAVTPSHHFRQDD